MLGLLLDSITLNKFSNLTDSTQSSDSLLNDNGNVLMLNAFSSIVMPCLPRAPQNKEFWCINSPKFWELFAKQILGHSC